MKAFVAGKSVSCILLLPALCQLLPMLRWMPIDRPQPVRAAATGGREGGREEGVAPASRTAIFLHQQSMCADKRLAARQSLEQTTVSPLLGDDSCGRSVSPGEPGLSDGGCYSSMHKIWTALSSRSSEEGGRRSRVSSGRGGEFLTWVKGGQMLVLKAAVWLCLIWTRAYSHELPSSLINLSD